MYRDRQRAITALSAGGIVAVATTHRASRLASALAPRMTSGSIIRKLLGKRGGAAVGSGGTAIALCAPGGPLAFACGAVVSGITWFAVDKAMIAYDETRYREQMKTEILDLLTDQKNDIKTKLKASHDVALTQMVNRVQQSIDRVFIPARDGV